MKTMMIIALGIMLVGSSTAAFAKKQTTHTTQTHHCQLKGVEVSKSKSACKKAGGVWEAGAPTSKPAAPAETEPMK